MTAPDLMHPQQCVNANLRKAARVAMQIYQGSLRGSELQGTQFTLLAAINGFGTCTVGELAAWLTMDQTTVTRSVALLRRARLVSLTRGTTDRRTRRLALTEAGRRQLAESLPRWRAAQAEVLERFGAEKARQLLALLQEFAALARSEGVAD